MGDKGFDPCECIWSHQLAMQRLLSILRQTQNYCTDNECFSISRMPGSHPQAPASDFFITFVMIAFVVFMYVLRPNSLRSRKNEIKTQNDGFDSNGDPPAPPPLSN